VFIMLLKFQVLSRSSQ